MPPMLARGPASRQMFTGVFTRCRTLVAPILHMTDWIKAQEFASRLDAEMAQARLESALIPSAIKADDVGIFGPGFRGAVPSGVQLFVPRELLTAAKDIIDPLPS